MASFSKDASKPAVMPPNYNVIFNDFEAYIASQPAFTKQAEYDKKPDDKSYQEILSQYEQLMNDFSYKGVNLLQQGNLKVNFNEERSSGIDIKGVDASGKALGLNAKGWETQMDILNSSANMVALQTRQQLAINSLSLASQAAQSVLKLF